MQLTSSSVLHGNKKKTSTRVVTSVVLVTEPSMAKSNESGVVIITRALILLYVEKMNSYLFFGFNTVYI